MIKKILYVAGVVIILAVIGLVALISSIDSKVLNAIQENLSALTGTRVIVDDIDISIFSGKGELSGLRISNPQGFSEEPALSLGRIFFEIDLDSLSMQMIPIKLIQGDAANIRVEKNAEGRINIQDLSQNVKKAMDRENTDGEDSPGSDFKVRISEFRLGEGNVTLFGFGEVSQDIKTPAITLQNLGGPSGAPFKEVGNQLLSGVLSGIIRHTLQSGIQKWIEGNTTIPESVKGLINKGLGGLN